MSEDCQRFWSLRSSPELRAWKKKKKPQESYIIIVALQQLP